MSITEKFRPKHVSDLVGNSKAISKVEDCILNSKVVLIYGPPGTGKTSCVHAIANDIGFKVREWNASDSRKKEDFEKIKREVESHPFNPTVYVLDEIDGAEHKKDEKQEFNGIVECIKNTRNPLVLICNDEFKIPKRVKELCERIRFYEPYVSDVTKVIHRIEQETGMKADYSKVSKDVRNSILSAFFGTDRYSDKNVFEIMTDFFKSGDITKLTEDHFIWLIDNGCHQFKGRKLYNFYILLEVCDRLNNFTPLKMFYGGKEKVEYPRYFRRLKALRREKR